MRRVGVAVVGVCALVAAACTAPASPDGSRSPSPTPTPPPVYTAEVRLPDDATTVLPGTDPATLAAGMSAALFATAPVAVVAPVDDVAAQLRAASAAVALGAPLLLATEPAAPTEAPTTAAPTAAPATSPTAQPTATPTTTPAPDPTTAELERLGVRAVLTVGDVSVDPPADVPVVGVTVHAGGATAEDDRVLAALLRVSFSPGTVTSEGVPDTPMGQVLALDRDRPVLLGSAAGTNVATATPTARPTPTPTPSLDATATPDTAEPTASPSPAAAVELPRTELADAPSGGLVLTTGSPAELAAVATARAAGVGVVTVSSGDPRVDSADVQAIAAAAPATTIAIGDGFGTADSLGWRVATAATGVELPGGGQTAFTARRMVAMYGCPTFPALGILGEQDVQSSIARAQGLAAQYQPLTTDRVVPAFEIIVTIASAGPGDDGNYSNELPVETFVPWVEAARDAGVYVVLDLQPGRTDFLTQAKLYEQLLLYPNVGLALDPEWRLAPDQVHLTQIGSVGIDEVNAVAAYLADLTRTHHLPQKVFVLHQFMQRMIQGRENLDTSHPELAMLIHADGQGSQGAKAGTWQNLHQGAPAGVAWGWKNFIDEDIPMATPEQTYQVQPVPQFVSYQ